MNSNSAIGFLINFYDFIKTHDIEIPRIQRDYTYGSLTEKTEEVLNKMLTSIHDALLDPDKEFILDFVYGSRNDNNTFEPLDGQQRLTTLFLLYLYAGWTSGAPLDAFHFNYSTRDNTADFCQSLVSNGTFKFNRICWQCGSCTKISDQIRDCAFFRPSFSDDPSIKSMLNVIDRIDEKFKDLAREGKLWKMLTENCPVKFYCLDFGKFGLSDDLYIKMNSRGKTLTDYEIFKSQLEKYLEVDLGEKEMKYEFAKKFDTDFTDLVWHEQFMDLSLIDDSFVSLFRNLLSIRNFLRGYNKSIVELKYLGDYIPQDIPQESKKKPLWYIDKEDIRFIIDFLDEFHKLYLLVYNSNYTETANDLIWGQVFYASADVRGEDTPEGDLERIRVFKTDINLFRTACRGSLKYADLVMLYAMYLTLTRHPLKSLDKEVIATWRQDINALRHIRNLIENSDDELSRPDFIATVMTEVNVILSGNIGTLAVSKFNSIQFEEEKVKAANSERWKNLYYYENHGIFRGALTLMAPAKEQAVFAINDDFVYDGLIRRLKKVNTIFENGSDSTEKDHFIRASLLSHVDYGQIYESDTNHGRHCYMYGRMPASWRLLLTKNSKINQSGILRLLDTLDETRPLAIQPLAPSDWRYYATREQWYDQTYYSYNLAKYGYYYQQDPSRPLEVYLLQSTSCADDNVMWKLLNWLLQYTLQDDGILKTGQSRLGDRKIDHELSILDEFTIDCLQEGWMVTSKRNQPELVRMLRDIHYTVSDEGLVEFKAEPDYVQFGVSLVRDIKDTILPALKTDETQQPSPDEYEPELY